MKRLSLPFALWIALLLGVANPTISPAARPNPPTIAGTVPASLLVTEPGGTNLVILAPRVMVLDQKGRVAADVETTVVDFTGHFNIPLKKAGTYVVVGYYPEPNRLFTNPRVTEVLRKQTTTISLTWQPQ